MNDKNKEILALLLNNNNNIFSLFSKQNNAYTVLWPVTKKNITKILSIHN